MRSTRTVEISTGLFVLLGFAALFFMVTQITNRELSVDGGSYDVTARFENIGAR
jgi:phospholipid/cholesterol/gamma-HCH transport system substrate-binding protein